MITYSKVLLKNFKLLKDNNIARTQCMVVLGINESTYNKLNRAYNNRIDTINKYAYSSKYWMKLFNEGYDIFKILGKYPEISSIAVLEKYFRNPFSTIYMEETLDKSTNRFKEWFIKEFVDKQRTLSSIGEDHGYTEKALSVACNKLNIRKTRLKNPRKSPDIKKYTNISTNPKHFVHNKEHMDIIGKALAILIDTNDSKIVSERLNVSPRYARRLHSDYNLFKSNEIPYNKIIKLINSGVVTLREIHSQLNLPKSIRFYLANNIIVSHLIGKTYDDIYLEEHRKCIYPLLKGDRTYLKRIKLHATVDNVKHMLSSIDPKFDSDLEKLKCIANGNTTNITEEELKSLMTKYYIGESK